MAREGINKSEWIRKQTVSIPAPELVKLAKREGIKLTAQQVHTVRYAMRKASEEKKVQRAAAPKQSDVVIKRSPGRPAKAPESASTSEAALRLLMLKVGTGRSRKMLESLETLTWS